MKKVIAFFKSVVKFLRNWNEIYTLPLALLLWWVGGTVLRWIDPTSGVHDAGMLQIFLLATVGLLFVNAFIWLILKLSSKDLYELLNEDIWELNDLTTWQKLKYSFWHYFSLLLIWTLLVIALS